MRLYWTRVGPNTTRLLSLEDKENLDSGKTATEDGRWSYVATKDSVTQRGDIACPLEAPEGAQPCNSLISNF